MIRALAIAKVSIWKVLSNVNRVEILIKLYESDQTWSDLMYNLRINPKSLRNHLSLLNDYHLIEKSGKVYAITDLGRKLYDLEFSEENDQLEEIISKIGM